MLYINYDGFTTTKSLTLSGGDYLSLGDVMGTDGTTALTIEGYIKPTLGSLMSIWNKRLNTDGPGVLLYITAAGNIQFFLEGSSSTRLRAQANTALTSGAWNHFAVSYTGSGTVAGVSIYINGSASAITNVQDNFSGSAVNTRPLWIGDREDAAYAFAGPMHRISRWTKALSSTEVTEARNLKSSAGLLAHSASANLEAYLRMGNDPMDDATGGTGVIKDRVGGFDGTPIGTVAGNIATDAP